MQKTIVLLALMAVSSFAWGDPNWSNLRVLKSEDRIGVVLANLKKVEGRFAGYSDSSISVQADQMITVPKQTVVRVYRRPRTRRTLRAVIGAAVGVGAGAVLTGTVGDRFRNEGRDVPAVAWIAGGAGIGAGIGALTGGGYQTIYQR